MKFSEKKVKLFLLLHPKSKIMKKNIVIFEAEWWSDKWLDGHRKDTMPIVEALKKNGWKAEVVFFRDEWSDDIFEYCKDKFDWYVTRVNPGNLPNGEEKYFETLRRLSDYGLVWMTHPDEMLKYWAKNVLFNLKNTDLVPDDTFVYYNFEDLKNNFVKTLKTWERVLKQNRGSTWSWIWRISVVDERDFSNFESLPFDTKIKATEAVDNHTEYKTLGEFIDFCKKYLTWKNGLVVDMKFLPRIVEWEIRILFVWENPIFVVHKKPAEAENSFSATLFSWAVYNYFKPDDYKELVDLFLKNLPKIRELLWGVKTPLIWTADFILDTDENWNDKYVLWEMNCSCVGFTGQLNDWIQEKIALEIIKNIENK